MSIIVMNTMSYFFILYNKIGRSTTMFIERECNIQNKVKIICPYCHKVVEVPMCEVINGEEISCFHCQKKIKLVCE